VVPAYAGARLAAERSDTNVDLLFTTALKPRAIIWGKFFSAVVLTLLIFSACLPFMTFAYLLRGIDIPTIALVLAVDFLAVQGGTQLAIFFGAVAVNRGAKIILAAVGLSALSSLFYQSVRLTVWIQEAGLGSLLDSWEFWAPACAGVAAVLTLMGLLFTWSVAIVSPATANRALPVRLFLLAAWLVTGAIVGLWIYKMPSFGFAPVFAWMICFVALFNLHLLISVCEREAWTPRVRRTIPRQWWLRLPAWLLYSGAAGGVVYAVVLIVLTMLFPFGLRKLMVASRVFDQLELVTRVMAGLSLYTFAYCLTAVFVRSALFGNKVKPALTWILAATLMGLGSVIPPVIYYFLHFNPYDYTDNGNWWLMGSPIWATVEIASGSSHSGRRFDLIYLTFAGVWSGVIALLSLPWAWRQWGRFRPITRRGERLAEDQKSP
jgi:hypothetical protein